LRGMEFSVPDRDRKDVVARRESGEYTHTPDTSTGAYVEGIVSDMGSGSRGVSCRKEGITDHDGVADFGGYGGVCVCETVLDGGDFSLVVLPSSWGVRIDVVVFYPSHRVIKVRTSAPNRPVWRTPRPNVV
jgi:hypothetical protein